MSNTVPSTNRPDANPLLEARQPTSWTTLIILMVVIIAPLIALSQVIAVWRWDVVDDQMFGYFGWRIAHGATVYIDVWDNKPPGIYWVNALGMLIGHDSYGGVVAMCVLALVAAHACFFAICASLYFRGAAAFTTILLSFYLTHAFFTGGTNRTETFLVPCELAAVLFYVRGFARDRWWKWYAAGAFCGLAFLFKQVGLAAWGSMGLHTIILVLTREVSLRNGLRRCLLLLGGLCSLIAVAAFALFLQGALGEAYFAVFGFNRAYFSAKASEWPYNYQTWLMLWNHFFPILLLPLLMAVAACIHAILWTLRPAFRPREIERQLEDLAPVCPRPLALFSIWFVALFGTWAVVSFWGALLSPHGFRHYLVPTIPPLLLLAGYLVNVLQAETKLLVRMQQRAWVTAAIVAIAYFSFDAIWRQWEEVSTFYVFREVQHGRAEWEVIGDVVADVTEPDDKIQCWGYYPGVYLHARRINTCRYTTAEKVGQVPGEADFVMRELDEKLKAEPPVALVVSSGDYEWLYGRDPQKRPPAVMLGPWIDATYDRVADIPYVNAYVFKRKDRVKPEDFQVLSRVRVH